MDPSESNGVLLVSISQGVVGHSVYVKGEESPGTVSWLLQDLIGADEDHDDLASLVSDLSSLIEIEVNTRMADSIQECDGLFDALSVVGVPEEMQTHLWETLAAILHLENLDFYDLETPDGVDSLCIDEGSDAVRAFCLLMGCSTDNFQTALTYRNVCSGRRTSNKGMAQSNFFQKWRDTYNVPEFYQMPLKRREAEARKLSLMKALCVCVFDYVAFMANATLCDASVAGECNDVSTEANVAIYNALFAPTEREAEWGALEKLRAQFINEKAIKPQHDENLAFMLDDGGSFTMAEKKFDVDGGCCANEQLRTCSLPRTATSTTKRKNTAFRFTIRHDTSHDASYSDDEFACAHPLPEDLNTFIGGVANPFVRECERLHLTNWHSTCPKSTRAPFRDASRERYGCQYCTNGGSTSSESEREQWDVMAELQLEIGNGAIDGDLVERQPISFDTLVDSLVQEQKNGDNFAVEESFELSEEYLSAVLDDVLREGKIEKSDPLCRRDRCSLHEEVEDVLSKQSAILFKHTAKLADAQRRGQELREENERLQQVAAQFEKAMPRRIKKREILKKTMASGIPAIRNVGHKSVTSEQARLPRKRLSPLKIWQR